MKFYLSVLLGALILFSSCGRKEYTEKGILEIKKEIDSLLYNPEGEEQFNWGSEEAYSNFRAYFHSDQLIFINEDFRFRQPGEQFNRYYFKDGNFLYYVGRELSFNPDKQFKNIEVMIDPDGNIIAYDKIVNGQRKNLDGTESKKLIEHAKELERIVSERSIISRK